nr:Unknown Function [uncultured bacterium]
MLTIYITHSKSFDFQAELYHPLRSSQLNSEHKIILPHENSTAPFNSKELIQSGNCDLILAEVSFPATGQGIELGWADAAEVPIICFYTKDAKISGSLKVICDTFVEYTDSEDMIIKLQEALANAQN